MTNRGGILIAVAALVALTGCSAATAEPVPTATTAPASVSTTPSAPAKVAKKVASNPNAQLEKQFAEFATLRAGAHGISDEPSEKETVLALHAFCEDDKPFKLSKSKEYNNNLDIIADKAYCAQLSK